MWGPLKTWQPCLTVIVWQTCMFLHRSHLQRVFPLWFQLIWNNEVWRENPKQSCHRLVFKWAGGTEIKFPVKLWWNALSCQECWSVTARNSACAVLNAKHWTQLCSGDPAELSWQYGGMCLLSGCFQCLCVLTCWVALTGKVTTVVTRWMSSRRCMFSSLLLFIQL